jgi:hypothetical protein
LEAKYWFFKHGWWIIPIFFIVTIIIPVLLQWIHEPISILALTAIVFGALFFIQKHCLIERKVSADLQGSFFNYFNALYPKLDIILNAGPEHDPTEAQYGDISAYINLCGEAYRYFCDGFIAPAVWRAWVGKMRVYYYHEKIRHQWDNALRDPEHYYGFTTEIIR